MESMTSRQARQFLQVGPAAIRGLIKKGKLHPVKVGNRLLFIAAEVKSLLIANVVVAKHE
ncbi:hypothetical protein BH11CYA1_BH11CYA1_36270 [soil metagenome]